MIENVKNTKKMYNEIFSNYILPAETVKKVQATLLMMLKDLDYVCRKHNIIYMLSGGSCLGAIRHKGFIPWDDDVDVIIYHNDMTRLCNAFLAEFPKKYTAVPPYTTKSPHRMFKIFLNNSKYVEIGSENFPTHKGLFIDVFPVVNVSASEKKTIILSKLHYLFSRLLTLCFDSKYPSSTVSAISKTNKELRKWYNMRRRIGFLSRLLGVKLWSKLTKKIESGYLYKTGREGIPSAISYSREIFESGFFSSVIEVDFLDAKFFVPRRYDEYLENLYGDYMQIPPIDKQERHLAILVDINTEI
ncbi:MAG: LicD family protein [Christensenellaceae bacterium]|nr:LicD family protein [Christensenellaceae bacterium]